MLLAITTEFLLFNVLAFANNLIELSHYLQIDFMEEPSQLETVLVEVRSFGSRSVEKVFVYSIEVSNQQKIVFCMDLSQLFSHRDGKSPQNNRGRMSNPCDSYLLNSQYFLQILSYTFLL